MPEKLVIPFSARIRSGKQQVEGVFPDTTRIGLMHLVRDLATKGYIRDWEDTSRELARISRTPSSNVYNKPERACEQMLAELTWQSAFDFCERLCSFLARDAGSWDRDGDFTVTTPLSDVKTYIVRELNRLFLEENFAYSFADGEVRRRGSNHSNEMVSKAGLVLGDNRLASARRHFSKAQGFFRDTKAPDFENAVKEGSAQWKLRGKHFSQTPRQLRRAILVKWMIASRLVPKTIAQTMVGLYGFRPGGAGIGHGGGIGGAATAELAEYVLAVAASQIIFLLEIANKQEPDIPF